MADWPRLFWQGLLGQLASRHDVVPIQVVDRREFDLPPSPGAGSPDSPVHAVHVPMARPPWWVRLMERILQPWIVIKREPAVPPFATSATARAKAVPVRSACWSRRSTTRGRPSARMASGTATSGRAAWMTAAAGRIRIAGVR